MSYRNLKENVPEWNKDSLEILFFGVRAPYEM